MPNIDVSAAFNDFGSAAQNLFGSRGAVAASDSYTAAAAIADQNVELAKQEAAIKETQTQRQIYQTIGKQQAQVGGAGMAESGSALDVLRSSMSQGALAKAMVANQGAITENAYAEQADKFRGMADAAQSSANKQQIVGIIQAAEGVLNIF